MRTVSSKNLIWVGIWLESFAWRSLNFRLVPHLFPSSLSSVHLLSYQSSFLSVSLSLQTFFLNFSLWQPAAASPKRLQVPVEGASPSQAENRNWRTTLLPPSPPTSTLVINQIHQQWRNLIGLHSICQWSVTCGPVPPFSFPPSLDKMVTRCESSFGNNPSGTLGDSKADKRLRRIWSS